MKSYFVPQIALGVGFLLLSVNTTAYSDYVHQSSSSPDSSKKVCDLYIATNLGDSNGKFYRKEDNANKLPRTKDAQGNVVVDNSRLRSTTPWGPATTGPWAVECERFVDGSITVDTVAQWVDNDPRDTVSNCKWMAPIMQAHAYATGFSTPLYQWSLSGTLYDGWPDLPQGTVSSSQIILGRLQRTVPNTPEGQPYMSGWTLTSSLTDALPPTSINVTVKEGDPALTAVYVSRYYQFKWHRPYEDWEPHGGGTHWQPFEAVAGSVDKSNALRNDAITGQFRWDNYTYLDHAWSEAFDTFNGLVSNMTPELYAGFFTAAGMLKEEYFSPSFEPHTVNFNDAWRDLCTDPTLGSAVVEGPTPPSGSEDDVAIMDMYRMKNPKIVVEYEHKFMQGNEYDQGGYVGINKKTVLLFTGRAHMAADFYYAGPGGQ